MADHPTVGGSEYGSGVDFSRANQARIYDYLLGGKDNYPPDRQAAEDVARSYPGGLATMRTIVRANRAFLGRAVHHLASEAGMRQFLDIGTGIPTAQNTHQVAQQVAPDSRVAYVDKDPIVLAHAEALLVSSADGATGYVDADLRDPERILREAAAILDFDRPVAVLLVAVLHMVGEHDDPYGIVARLMRAVPAGSQLVISHAAKDVDERAVGKAADQLSERMTEPVWTRDHGQISRFFDGLELLDPGVVQVQRWRSGVDADDGRDLPIYAAVGRKP